MESRLIATLTAAQSFINDDPHPNERRWRQQVELSLHHRSIVADTKARLEHAGEGESYRFQGLRVVFRRI